MIDWYDGLSDDHTDFQWPWKMNKQLFCFGEQFFGDCKPFHHPETHSALLSVLSHSLPILLHIKKKKKKMCWGELLYVLQAVKKNRSEQSQVEQLSQTQSCASIRLPFIQSRWTWETSSLTNLIITHPYLCSRDDNSYPGRARTILLNTVWYHLLTKLMSCPDYFSSKRFDSVVSTTHAGACLLCSVITVAHVTPRITAIRHHPHDTHWWRPI